MSTDLSPSDAVRAAQNGSTPPPPRLGVSESQSARPANGGYMRRETRTGEDDAVLGVAMMGHFSSVLSVESELATVRVSVCLSREQLEEFRDAINAVLVGTEPE